MAAIVWARGALQAEEVLVEVVPGWLLSIGSLGKLLIVDAVNSNLPLIGLV